MVRILPESAVERVVDLDSLLPVVADALVKQSRGEVERPERPHFPIGAGLDGDEPLGTGIAMPAYIHGEEQFATKLVSLNEGNEERGLPTLHAQIVLTDARTGQPEAFMAATTITNARTGCIGGLAVRELAPDAMTVGVLGAGAQARWQTRAIATVGDLQSVRIYSPSDSREHCALDLQQHAIPAEAVDSPRDAVEGADVVVTATTSSEPVFPADALQDGALVVAIGAYTAEMQEVEAAVYERAGRVFADVPAEVAETGDLLATDLNESDLLPLGDLLAAGDGDRSGERSVSGEAFDDDPVVVKSVGSATLDAAAGAAIYEAAEGAGTDVSME
jgi:alanine dehydrogenase